MFSGITSGDVSPLTKHDRPEGTIHKSHTILKETWMFSDNGRYAVVIEEHYGESGMSDQQQIIVYDLLEKQAFDYLCEGINITPFLYYWYSDFLVIVDSVHHLVVYCFELNHEKRNVRLIHARQFPDVRNCDSTTACMVSIDDCECFPLFHTESQTIFCVPKDPFSTIPPKQFIIKCPYTGYRDNINGINEEYFLYPEMMSYKSSLYFFKTMEVDDDHHLFRLDHLIQIDLTKLKNVYGKEVDRELILAEQDLTAYSEVRLNIGNVNGGMAYLIGCVFFGSRLSSSANGFEHIMGFYHSSSNLPNLTWIIDLRTKQVTYLPDQGVFPTTGECLHPSGKLLRIFYGYGRKLECKVLGEKRKSMKTLKEIIKDRMLFGEKLENQINFKSIVDRFL